MRRLAYKCICHGHGELRERQFTHIDSVTLSPIRVLPSFDGSLYCTYLTFTLFFNPLCDAGRSAAVAIAREWFSSFYRAYEKSIN